MNLEPTDQYCLLKKTDIKKVIQDIYAGMTTEPGHENHGLSEAIDILEEALTQEITMELKI